jgi:hypothetical protein|tara:strand:- start:133 stop:450 length:318 start_codon:yes stop_codon:yes gene_type:complete
MDKRILKGFQSEITAEYWLTKQGFIVYSKKAVQSPIDFICYNPEDHAILLVDVKSSSYRRSGQRANKVNNFIYRSPTPVQKKIGVRLLYVSDEGECSLDTPINKC